MIDYLPISALLSPTLEIFLTKYSDSSDYYRYPSGPTGGYGYGGPGSGYGGASSTNYPPTDVPSNHFRGRGYTGDGYPNDWRSNKDYRREYDRRPPPPNGNS